MTENNQPARTITALIADDEPLARELLRSMLSRHPELHILGECRDGEETITMVRKHQPDLLFLDIQMPEQDGFEVLREIPEDRMPVVIFVTAYDQYAIRAFEVHALDYLLKPFDEERLERAVTRAQHYLDSRHQEGNQIAERMYEMLRQMQTRPQYTERVVIRDGDRAFLQPAAEIDWLEADGKYTRVHVGKEIYSIREGITKLEQELDPSRFLRISRSAIVNIDQIKELRSWFQGDYLVVLKNGKQLTSTRTYREGLQALLGRRA
jgi:two-component system LytT family response regulator